jgi:hypothetical protein
MLVLHKDVLSHWQKAWHSFCLNYSCAQIQTPLVVFIGLYPNIGIYQAS